MNPIFKQILDAHFPQQGKFDRDIGEEVCTVERDDYIPELSEEQSRGAIRCKTMAEAEVLKKANPGRIVIVSTFEV